MQNINQIIQIKNLFSHIGKRRIKQFLLLLILTILSGITEIVSIASVVPFVSIVTGGNFLEETKYLSHFLSINNKQEAIIVTGILFSSLYLLNSLVRIFLIYVTARLSTITTAEINSKIYKTKLYQNYEQQIKKNSSDIISAITQKGTQIYAAISSLINIVSGSVIFISIMTVLIWVNPTVMIVSILFFGLLYLLFVKFGRRTIQKSSKIINDEQNRIVLNLQNGLGSIRDIIINKSQEFYLKLFNISNFNKAKREAITEFIQSSPRYIFEGMGIVLFVTLLIYSSMIYGNDQVKFSSIFPTLAALALGSQRILPILNKLYVDYITIKAKAHQIDEVIEILDEGEISNNKKRYLKEEKINFKKTIIFKNVFFSYDKKKNTLENINLTIKKGSKIGIIGRTGQGKSTFLDLIMGLLHQDKGEIFIDDRKLSKENILNWQSKISQVPQKIFLSDDTFLKNIAFGIKDDEIDIDRVELVSKKSQIHSFIANNDDGYYQKVGERGLKLSGGQIQRVGLARALYKFTTEVIIFDEATNSLDHETEKLVMEELYKLDKKLTIIIVAHRLNTIENCDSIFEIKDKKIFQIK